MSTNIHGLINICLIGRYFDLRNAGIGRFSMEMRNGLINKGYRVISVGTKHKSDAGYLIYTSLELAYKIPKRCSVYHCLTPMETIYAPKQSTIVTFHDIIPLLHLDKLETHYAQGPFKNVTGLISKRYFEFAAKQAAKCARVVCTSEQSKKELIDRLGIDEKIIEIVRLGIARGLEPRPKKDNTFRIGTLSYLDRRKRIDLLIEAFLKADVDGELIIGGSGVDHDRLVYLAHGDIRIKFAGFVPEDRLCEFYNSCDLLVFPTKVEGYGMPIVEAFACKKPVVVLQDSIIPDEVKSRCLVVENLVDYLKNPFIPDSLENNLSFAAIHNWDYCIEQYLSLYKHILGKNNL